MNRRLTKLFWIALALLHAFFLVRLALAGEAANAASTGGTLRWLGLLGCVVFCLIQAALVGHWLPAFHLPTGRGLIAFWMVVALLHAGVPVRAMQEAEASGAIAPTMLVTALVAVTPLALLALEARLRRRVREALSGALRALKTPKQSTFGADGRPRLNRPPRPPRALLHVVRHAQLPPPAPVLA